MSKMVLQRSLGVTADTVVGRSRLEGGDVVYEVRPKVRAAGRCPVCGGRAPVYDHPGTVRWRALDQGCAKCWVEYDRARVSCPEHGVVAEAVPWADGASRFTRDFEDQAAWLACSMPASGASELLRVAWPTVGSLCSRALARLEAAGPDRLEGLARIGLDETGFATGRVMTVVTDLDRGCAVWCCEGVGAAACDAFFSMLSRRQRRAIRVVAGDGADWVDNAARKWCPLAKRVMDPFHVVQWANDCLDGCRRAAWRAAKDEADELGGKGGGGRRRGRPRKGEGAPPESRAKLAEARAAKLSRWALLKRPERLSGKQRAKLAEVEAAGGELWRCYVAKEGLRAILAMPGGRESAAAAAALDAWLDGCEKSGYARLERLAASVRARRKEILRSISMGVSNGLAESTNAKIKMTVAAGRGFRNFANLRSLVMLRCSPTKPVLPGRAV